MNQNLFFCLLVGLLVSCTLGCETTDYEPLRVKRKLKELDQKVQQLQQDNRALRIELDQLKKGQLKKSTGQSTVAGPRRDARSENGAALQSRMKMSLVDQQQLCAELEAKNVFFSTDGSGYAMEADLTECPVADVNSVLQQISNFDRLKRISFAGSNTNEQTFDVLATMPSVERLDLPNATITEPSMAQLAALPRLAFLELNTATLGAGALAAIARSKSLKQLRCAKTGIGDAELKFLANLKTLEAIDLSECNRVTSEGLRALTQCPRIKFLKVYGKSINDSTLDLIARMTSLRVLGLNDTAITDAGVAKLGSLNLVEIHLFRTAVGDQAMQVLAKMPNLSVINLRDTRVSDRGMAYLTECSKLRRIDLSECNSPGITDVGCESLAQIASLDDVYLWKTKVTDRGITHLAALTKLKKLNLDDTNVGDDAVQAIGQMKNLTWLHLGKTNVTDASVGLLQKMTKLTFLDITFTNQLSEDAGYEIADALEPLGCYVKL